ncbi:MAG: NAD(P)H-dependent glycerol-3-phosphate dehydrogenase [Candidatus Aminicenantales bacterium]
MKASVIGGGTWGSTFALHLSRLNIETNLWIREQEILQETAKERENRVFLPGYKFPQMVSFHDDFEEAVRHCEVVFIAVPSKFCRQIYKKLAPFLSSDQTLVSLTKGIEENSLMRMSEVMEDEFNPFFRPRIAALSGPSFAQEVAQCHPTAVVLASKEMDLAKKIQHVISSENLRVYTSDDIIGVELGGALKNIIAIAAGILDALHFGSNSTAALITRGLSEITRLGVRLGARKETFSGLAGVGDLVLTCTGRLSRNRHIGYELGKGKPLKEIVSGMKMVAEGITTTVSARQLARREHVEMPICEQVYQVLYNNKDPKHALQDLMTRRLKEEY